MHRADTLSDVEIIVESSPIIKICTAMIHAYERLSVFSLFFQVIRVGGKYMHRQTRSYQGDLIQWVQDISLIGHGSISHAQKVSVASYHTVLL